MAISKSLDSGEVLGGRYRIISPIGQGGMGAVFLAEDLKLKGKKWAVKAISLAPGEETRLALEAEMLVSLQHPQLPHIVDYFLPDENGLAYMVMDYVQGPTLLDAFERSGRKFTDSTVIRYAVQLCDLLHYLHTYKPRPIIYRDLKPSNIMLDETGNLRLIDFGIARHYKFGQHADTVRIGTIGFAAPEQIAGEQTDPRSDLYALGALMYYLLTQGSMYYLTSSPLPELRPDLPVTMTYIVQRLLEEDAGIRVQTAVEAKERLLAITDKGIATAAKGISSSSASPFHLQTLHAAEEDSPDHHRLIVVGGLYPGAGSTFVAVTLARMLHAYGVESCLVEHPTIEPDLYMLLFGDKNAPKGFSFAPDMIVNETVDRMGDSAVKSSVWMEGKTTWVPSNPDGMQGEWTIADTFKLLHRVRKTVTIWDVSTSWEEASVAELCHAADKVLVVADASPSKISRPTARKRLSALADAEWIANRDIQNGRKDWLHSLPKLPVCKLPELPRDAVLRSMWKGTCIQDEPSVRELLLVSLQPILSEIIPAGTKAQLPSRDNHNKWLRFFKRAN